MTDKEPSHNPLLPHFIRNGFLEKPIYKYAKAN